MASAALGANGGASRANIWPASNATARRRPARLKPTARVWVPLKPDRPGRNATPSR
jgi:hypothetical protein